MTKYKVYLVRHGKTWFNRYDKMQGWSDSPLAPDGVEVAKDAADALKDFDFSAAFSSDARRAIDTCKIIVDANKNHEKVTPVKLPEFREEFYGYFEGTNSHQAWFITGQPVGCDTYGDLIAKVGMDRSKDLLKEADPFHDAENAEEYWERINKGFAKLDEVANDGDTILLVSHGTTIRSITDRYNAGNFDITVSPLNSSLTIMEVDDGERKVTTYNKMLK